MGQRLAPLVGREHKVAMLMKRFAWGRRAMAEWS